MDDKSKGTQGDGSLPSMPLRLLADEMLGRLARWLRLLGYDTLYETGLSDHQLAARARHEDRVLLTRDRELARRKGIRCLLVRSQELEEQLEQVIDTLGAPAAESEPRCSSCNAQLISISRQEASLHVPAFVLDTQAEGDLLLLRWAVLAAATLNLLFSVNIVHPIPGWVAVALGASWNVILIYRRQQGPTGLAWCVLAQIVDSAVLVAYTAALQGGVVRHLPLYTTMLTVATIRFGLWGAIASAVLGAAIVVLTALGAPLPWAEPTVAVGIGTMIGNAVLLGYLAYLVRCEQVRHQEREQELQRSVSEITVLHEVSSVAHDLRSEDALQDIVEIVTGFMGFQRAALFLTDKVGGMIPHRYYSSRRPSRRSTRLQLSMEPALFEAVLQRRHPIVIDGSQGLPQMDAEASLQIAVPLHSDAGPIGVLVADSNDRRETIRSDMIMLSNLAKSAVVAIENASLHRQVARMANYDGVTDLYNHRYFQERIREMLRLTGGRESVSLLMVEIDKFKKYNDTFGHRQGDTALYSLSRALEQSTQHLDGLVARYGGDEFVVILPAVGRESALQVARQIQSQVYEVVTELLARQNLPPVMLSIGVATYPDDAQDAGSLIEAADQAMYVVKHSGGNRVHAYSAPKTTQGGNTGR
jgi:diguanylate cyclase (GGDEF)-like protein